MTKKEIRKKILNDVPNSEIINECLEEDFELTIKVMFAKVKDLSDRYNKINAPQIFELLKVIDEIVSNNQDNRLDVIVICCLDFKDKNSIDNNPKIKGIITRIDEILESICYENSNNCKFDNARFLKFLINEDKDISRIKIFLSNTNTNFRNTFQYSDVIEDNLKKLETKDIEKLKYYYKIVILLISKINNNLLIKNVEHYKEILESLKQNMFIKDIIKILNNSKLYQEDFLRRFNIELDFDEAFNSIEIFSKTNSGIPNLRQKVITIDTKDTIRMDDAIYIKKNKDNTYTLYAHVSYIPDIIELDSAIDLEARKRAQSIYIFNQTIPIYPSTVILNNCSLNKNKYSNAITYSIKLNKNLEIIPDTLKITRTNIKPIKNYSHDDLNNLILYSNDNNQELNNLIKLLTIFTLNYNQDYNLDVEKLLGDDNFYLDTILNYDSNNLAREIITAIMREVNYQVAKYFKERKLPYIYKISKDNLKKEKLLMRAVNDNYAVPSNKQLIDLLETTITSIELSHRPEKFYDLDCYSSSTDPLWKYSASYNQYLVKNLIFAGNITPTLVAEWKHKTKRIVKDLNYKLEENRDVEILCNSLNKTRKLGRKK